MGEVVWRAEAPTGAVKDEGFPEDDPRAEQFSPEQRSEAAAMMHAVGRWHMRKKRTDMFAVQLQIGRGMSIERAAMMFGISESCIRERITRENWLMAMSEHDRRNLSRLVWLGGLMQGARESEELLAALRAASEWRLWKPDQPLRWRPRDRLGEQRPMTVDTEISDDAYANDSRREERDAMLAKLDAILAEIDAGTYVEEEEEAAAHPEGDAPESEGDLSGEGAEGGNRVAGSGGRGEGVGPVGA